MTYVAAFIMYLMFWIICMLFCVCILFAGKCVGKVHDAFANKKHSKQKVY